LTLYLDASVAVSLFTQDAHSNSARRLIGTSELLLVSDLTAGEFSSALAIQHRSGRAAESDVRAAYANFDAWCETIPVRVEVLTSDIRAAQAIVRQLEHPLKLPDAMHIIIARRLGATLATFDATMAREAPRLGLQLVEG